MTPEIEAARDRFSAAMLAEKKQLGKDREALALDLSAAGAEIHALQAQVAELQELAKDMATAACVYREEREAARVMEREACAQLADESADAMRRNADFYAPRNPPTETATAIATAIRSRR